LSIVLEVFIVVLLAGELAWNIYTYYKYRESEKRHAELHALMTSALREVAYYLGTNVYIPSTGGSSGSLVTVETDEL
jgi:hypothetical protein